VATTLDEAAGNTDGRAFACNDDKRRAPSMTLGQDSLSLDTGPNGDCAALVGARALVRVDPVNLLEIVGVDNQRTIACAATDEVMAGIPYN
jgi:hypothetical protein